MGYQLDAGDRGIFISDGAKLVVNWCDRFAPRVKPDGMSDYEWFERMAGSTHIMASAAKLADQNVPIGYAEAKSAGFLDGNYRHEICEECFRQCRDFLRHAAENNLDISGSF